MKIKWFGHSCFLITSDKGIKIVTDPFDETVGYKLPDVETNIVSTSHEHYDHNNAGIFKGTPVLVKGSGRINIKGIELTGVETFHDEDAGKKRGLNTVFKFELDGLNVCHLGDLGHILTSGQVKELGKVDILLTPVGGIYTIDHIGAVKVMEILQPAVTIPMHYKTKALKFSLSRVDEFLDLVGDYKKVDGTEIEISRKNIGDCAKVVVLDYK
ncbi:MBL fold metallo-hydrolase [Acetivibrio cellulolyticus]|uniref:MBL fold metallo-hydrolase n=1 Tax=Acetivibrio cellulolyticus TaxID=35830 RepID=UPI0001E2E6AB|nr:MBL fold metallo-hydrolase [Acetivibrio cellulolyticus]